MPIFLPPPSPSHRGPDGQGWNRLSLFGLQSPQCALRPARQAAFWEAMDTRRARYGGYLACTGGGACDLCPRLRAHEVIWPWFGEQILVRVDETDTPWAMHRPERGWGEYGEPTTWSRLARLDHVEFRRYRDEHGPGILLTRVR